MRDHIRFIFRGKPMALSGFAPTRSVLDWLREDQRATGTKEGCNEGDCGACTAVVARLEGGRLVHRPINTCITFLGMLDGAELITIEDLADGGRLHPIQQAMVEHHGSQCGFCTPGIVMSLFAMDKAEGAVTRAAINDQLAGNLCRCTGYRPIVDAALANVGEGDDRFDRESALRAETLARLMADGDVVVPAPPGFHPEATEASAGFFAAPRSLEALLALTATHPDATIVAGATDVGLWITKQFRPVRKIIWVGNVVEFDEIINAGDALILSAGATHEAALPHLSAISPDLGELGRRFGSKQVRAQGTVGGNIANGSPIGDWAPALIALGASVTLQAHAAMSPPGGDGEKGVRTLPLEAFFIAYGKQDRRPGEIVTSLTIPKLKADEHFRCFKISKRFDEDISAVMGAFSFQVADGRVESGCVAFGGMAATPRRAQRTEALLAGILLAKPATWEPAIAALAEDFQPIDDMRASAWYRREVAQALLRKALIEIGGGESGVAPRTRLHDAPALAAE